MCYGSKFGLATLLVSDQFCNIERSWRFEERCTAVFFETTLIMAVCAPDCGKDLGMHEAFISSVSVVLREGRRGSARDFYIFGDLIVELGFMCTDEKYMRCTSRCVGKGTKMIMAVSRTCCGMES